MTSMQSIRDVYRRSLPERPYCTNYIGRRPHIQNRDRAICYSHIQINSPLVWRWIVCDIDGEDGYERAEDRHCPKPNFIAMNRNNGHSHIGYLLEAPVTGFEKSSRHAIRFYDDIQRGLTHRLGADLSYGGFLCKNPCSSQWLTDWQAVRPYDLETLGDFLDKADKRRRPAPELSNVGRNVMLFDSLRVVAYRQWRIIRKRNGTFTQFEDLLHEIGARINSEFLLPLLRPEVRCVARSVAKWVWGKFSNEDFSRIQKARIAKRWADLPTLAAAQPWLAKGISRATWFRHKA